MTAHVQLTQPDRISTAESSAWHRVVAASMAHDLPGVPVPGPEEVHARLTEPALGSRRLTWTATSGDGSVIGVAVLRLFTWPGQDHLAELDLHVDPAHRRAGNGSLLLSAAVAACRDENRRSLVATTAAEGAGEGFCLRSGFKQALSLDHLILPLSGAERAEGAEGPDLEAVHRIAGAAHPGYRLTGWTGTVPDGLAAAFATAKSAMNDMPMGDVDFGRVEWDEDRVRTMAGVVADRGDTLLTIAALHEDGDMAGYTEIVLPQGRPPRAQQYDTAVVPGHRGHGLGLWLKAAMVCRLLAEHPAFTEIETDNAEDNVHMLAVNRALGFRSYRRTREFQLDLSAS